MTEILAPVLGEATVQELRDSLRGGLLLPGDDGYDEAKQLWNGAHDARRPAAVARATGVADVMAALGFARAHDLTVAVRGGGHSVAGLSTVDGGMLIDLSAMRNVRVDPIARVAYVGPGATWGDVDHEAQQFGLATTGGLVSTTGVAGFTLGGGIGWLMRQYGLACDNLVGADVVTADGRLVRASATENPELFWGLRGGGGNFGIVTSFELALHPVGPEIYAGPLFLPGDAAGDLLRFYRDWAPSAPDAITTAISLAAAPPLPVIPEEWHGKKVAILIAVCAGPVEDGEALVRDLRTVAEPVADLIHPMPYTFIQSLLDPLWPKGINAYFKAANLARLSDETIDSLVRLHQDTPGPQCEIHVHQMGGAVARVGQAETAFPERSMPYVVNAVTGTHDPDLLSAHAEWARAVIASAKADHTGRAYVNFLSDADGAEDAYGEDTYRRLAALKDEYDPTNVFRLNQNVAPSA
ncbi:MAG TPA: FAD-binding oxidoreductase [Gaiellaceae bacterium]|nr:FAD-binding oxidoreductase [Gaiellaceae bacterium]